MGRDLLMIGAEEGHVWGSLTDAVARKAVLSPYLEIRLGTGEVLHIWTIDTGVAFICHWLGNLLGLRQTVYCIVCTPAVNHDFVKQLCSLSLLICPLASETVGTDRSCIRTSNRRVPIRAKLVERISVRTEAFD